MRYLVVAFSVLLLCLCHARLAPTAVGAAHPSVQSEDTRLDVNAATAEQLQSLPGIGAVIASRILERRLNSGPFTRLDDLLGVAGIGPAKLNELRPLLRVGEPK